MTRKEDHRIGGTRRAWRGSAEVNMGLKLAIAPITAVNPAHK
jgi:hypothetical protein